MDRKDFLKKAGIALVAGPLLLHKINPFSTLKAAGHRTTNCVLLPFHTGGPFYLDPEYNRSDITEQLAGLPLNLKLTVVGVQNCAPVPDAVVNIWQTNAVGAYSQFGTTTGNTGNHQNDTWLRGYQTTDSNGECNFSTIFPGWYPGRATHIHFDVHLGFQSGGTVDQNPDPSHLFMGQMYFPDAEVSQIYTQVAEYTGRGNNPTGLTNDFLLNSTGQVNDLTVALDFANYPTSIDGEFCIGVDTTGVPTSMDEPQKSPNFEFHAVYGNSYSNVPEVRFLLHKQGEVTLSVFDAKGRMVSQILKKTMGPGEYGASLDRQGTGLAKGVYTIDMVVQNQEGLFRSSEKIIVQ